MEGLALKNVTLTVKKDGKKVFSDFGEMVFTAKGISGPLVLSASAHLDGKKHTYPYQAFIDLKPALDAETLDKRLLRDFAENSNRDFSNALSQLLPAKMIPVAVQMCGIPGNQKVHTITRAQRENLCALLKEFTFTVVAAGGWDEAVVTAGGVAVASAFSSVFPPQPVSSRAASSRTAMMVLYLISIPSCLFISDLPAHGFSDSPSRRSRPIRSCGCP